MGKHRVRYLVTRQYAGRTWYYWHNPHAAARGMVREALGCELGPAIARAEQLNAAWDRLRTEGPSAGAAEGTLAWWLDQLEAEPAFAARPRNTQSEVRSAFRRLRETPLAGFRLAAIAGDDVTEIYRGLARRKGVDMAHRTCKWLKWALGRAHHAKRIPSDPTQGLRLARPGARQEVWEDAEIEAAIAAALRIERPSAALAFRLAADLGQREGDLIRLPWSRVRVAGDGTARVIVTQRKTGATVGVRATAALHQALASAREQAQGPLILVYELTGQPYTRDQAVDTFRAVIAAAGKAVRPGLQFRDLRRTAVVRLAEAGATVPMISAITGHSLLRVEQILETYLPRTAPMADAGIALLEEHRRQRRGKPAG